jgi:hypothetical protein
MPPLNLWKDAKEDMQRECDEIMVEFLAKLKKESIRKFKEMVKE